MSSGKQTSTLSITKPERDMVFTCVVTSGSYPQSPKGEATVSLQVQRLTGMLQHGLLLRTGTFGEAC